MLVYVRESAADEVLRPFTEADTPSHLRKRLEDEKIQLDTKKREKEEQHLYLTVKVRSILDPLRVWTEVKNQFPMLTRLELCLATFLSADHHRLDIQEAPRL